MQLSQSWNAVRGSGAQRFTRQRRAIRDALIATGVAGRIDGVVARLLDRPEGDGRVLEGAAGTV